MPYIIFLYHFVLAAEMIKVTFDAKHFLFYRTQLTPNNVQVLSKILIFHFYWTSGPSKNLSILSLHGYFTWKTPVNWITIPYYIFLLKKVLSSLQLPMLEIIGKQGNIRKQRGPLSPEDPVKRPSLLEHTLASQLLKWATNRQKVFGYEAW